MQDTENTKKNKEINWQSILRQFDCAYTAVRDVREECIYDRRFASVTGGMWAKHGATWRGEMSDNFVNKPKMEVNKGALAIVRLINEYRSNRITVDFVNEFGEKEDVASTLDGLYRACEKESIASEAYDNGFEEAVTGGFGAFRLTHCLNDEDDEEDDEEDAYQKIVIEPIFDADLSVFFDINSKRQDKRDAKKCWVIFSMSREEFEIKYPNTPLSEFRKPENGFNWGNQNSDVIYLAEYYEVEESKQRFYVLNPAVTGDQILISEEEKNEDSSYYDELILRGYKQEKIKTKKIKKVHKYILSGLGVLEDLGYIAGTEIPIIPIYGKRFYIDNVEYCAGHIRYTKDIAVVKNMIISKLAEFSALSASEKPIMHIDQVAGLESFWKNAQQENYAYLPVKSIKSPTGQDVVSGPLGYSKPADLPPVLAALLQQTEFDIAEILGNQQQGDKIVSNISADAIERVQERLDNQSYIYIDNFAKAMRRAGEVFLSMAKEIYVEENRKVKSVGVTGDSSTAILNQKTMKDGFSYIKNDISNAKLKVNVDVGPSSSSRNEKNNKKLLALLPYIQDPETMNTVMSLLLMNTDFEGGGDIKDYYRKKLVMQGIIEPNEEEKQILEEQAKEPKQPNPQDAYLLASAEKLKADTQKISTDITLNQAKVDLTKADTIKTLHEAGQSSIPQNMMEQPQL